MIELQAHRGVSTEAPENTMPAIIAAAEQGYSVIELDVSVTADMRFVLLHDKYLDRTARCADGSAVERGINISGITYEQARGYDFGIWFSSKFAGTEIPLLEEALEFAAKRGLKIKIDNKYEEFDSEQTKAFFELIAPFEDTACLTCKSIGAVRAAVKRFSRMHIHYDGDVTDAALAQLSGLVPRERLTVWLPYKNRYTQWVKTRYADAALAAEVKRCAQLGIWIISEYGELEAAKRLGADTVETAGQLKPEARRGVVADMHTHSVHSHDSVCRVEDMCLAQIARGTEIMAVTDHCDVFSCDDHDIYTPLERSYTDVCAQRENYGNRCQLLAGVEISEGFYRPAAYKKVMSLLPYDAVIGSVHCVRYPGMEMPYSKIDFSDIEDRVMYAYLGAYFDDVAHMIESGDFDILAHLTCPLRYMTGKYKRHIDIEVFNEKITALLERIIKRGIALEVNTSAWKSMGRLMPDEEILKKYRAMGGYLVTLGSDAHSPENASAYIGEALEVLKRVGFKNIFYYKNRQGYQCGIAYLQGV